MGCCKKVKEGFSLDYGVKKDAGGGRGDEKLTSGSFEGKAVFLNRDRVLRRPELRENVGHSRNPKKSVMDQA